MTDRITPQQFHEAEGVADWRVVGDGACAYFRTGSLAAGARLVQAIGQLPGVEDHRPDIDVRGAGVTVRLITYTADYYGMSRRDVELAATLKGLAQTLPWFVERAFAEALGPIAGQIVADAGRRMLGLPGYAGERFGDSVTSYVRDEVSLGATADQVRTFGDDVSETAARVNTLEARIEALSNRLPDYDER